MTEKEVQAIVGKDRVLAGHMIVCENVRHLISGQQDVISVNKNRHLIEYEIKLSRGDFFRDKNKAKKIFYDHPEVYADKIPNQFYYVVPESMITVDELPRYAGLYYIIEGQLWLHKKAPLIHSVKHDLARIYKKVATIMQERKFLGCCRLTYENNKTNSNDQNGTQAD